jgi:hypothetical protein
VSLDLPGPGCRVLPVIALMALMGAKLLPMQCTSVCQPLSNLTRFPLCSARRATCAGTPWRPAPFPPLT